MARKKKTAAKKTAVRSVSFDAPRSRNEAILQNILGANNVLEAPQSRNEAILQAILNGTSYTEAPQSRTEELLLCILNGTTTDMVPQSRNEEILVAKINGGSYDEAPQSRIEELLIQWLNATPAYVEKTVTGNPISIADAIAAEAVALSVALEPIQDLNGYESPWPAGGGVNKFDITNENITASNFGITEQTISNTNTDTRAYFAFVVQAYNGSTAIQNASASLSISSTGRKAVTITIESECTALRIRHNGSTRDFAMFYPWTTQGTITISIDVIGYDPTTIGGLSFKDVMIVLGSTAPTSYSPYSNICPISGHDVVTVTRTDGDGQQSISLTIPLGDTVYGGTVDVTNGVLTIDRIAIDLADVNWIVPSNKYHAYGTPTSPNKYKMANNNVMYCSMFKPDGAALGGNYYGDVGTIRYWYSPTGIPPREIYINAPITFTDAASVIAYVGGQKYSYPLEEPITVPLTPQILAMLAGTNIIQSAEADNLSLTYKATN